MDKKRLAEYIKTNKGVEMPALQQEFSLTYKQAKDLVDRLTQDGVLRYESGVRYVYTPKDDDDSYSCPSLDKPCPIILDDLDDDEEDKESNDWFLRAASVNFGIDDKEEEDISDDDFELDDDEDTDEEEDKEEDKPIKKSEDFLSLSDEVRYRVLKFVIENGEANCTEVRDILGLTLLDAYKVFRWMENNHYIETGNWANSRRIRVTLTDLKNLYPELYKNDYGNALKYSDSEESSLSEDDFIDAVAERVRRLICSDKKMGKQGAVKKAETWLEAVKDTNDKTMVEVYERLVYEIKHMSRPMYDQLKKQLFDK